MRILVTGATGFVGRHLARDLSDAGHAVLRLGDPSDQPDPGNDLYTCDLRDADGLRDLARTLNPEACIHLGGIAFVPMGWTDPHLVFDVNTNGTLNLLEALRATVPKARVLVVSSAEVYGRSPSPGLLSEDAPLHPQNLYAVSKAAADLSALLYFKQYGTCVMTARPQNHIGPGQSRRFVTSSFAEQLAQIAAGQHEAVMRVGNLDSERDFTDVRDVVRAYRLLIENGRAGEAYNIASSRNITVREVLDHLCSIAQVQPELQVDEALFRPTDIPPVLDTSKLQADTGWNPAIDLEQSLRDLYDEIAAEGSLA